MYKQCECLFVLVKTEITQATFLLWQMNEQKQELSIQCTTIFISIITTNEQNHYENCYKISNRNENIIIFIRFSIFFKIFFKQNDNQRNSLNPTKYVRLVRPSIHPIDSFTLVTTTIVNRHYN